MHFRKYPVTKRREVPDEIESIPRLSLATSCLLNYCPSAPGVVLGPCLALAWPGLDWSSILWLTVEGTRDPIINPDEF